MRDLDQMFVKKHLIPNQILSYLFIIIHEHTCKELVNINVKYALFIHIWFHTIMDPYTLFMTIALLLFCLKANNKF